MKKAARTKGDCCQKKHKTTDAEKPVRCDDRRSVLHRLTQRAAMADAAHWEMEENSLLYI